MPLYSHSGYRPVPYLFNGHLETIVPSILREVEGVAYKRERIHTTDGDFLDLDWLAQGNKQLVIISHGLEGSSARHYCKGMARYFHHHGWDALAWNCRSCSGEMNRLPRFYHHGDTDDLKLVIQHALSKNYHSVALVGFSMGGSMSLKLLGETIAPVPVAVKAAVVFSVPCHLGSSAAELDTPAKSFYRNRFLKKLEKKIRLKENLFPGIVSAKGFEKIRTFREFDSIYTAPLHGFKDANDFYERASSGNYLAAIAVPTLIVNAANDPFLPPACYPTEVVRTHQHLFLEIPKRGGHVGFSWGNIQESWMELRAYEFISRVVEGAL